MLKRLSVAVALVGAFLVASSGLASASIIIFSSGETASTGDAAPAGSTGAFGGAFGPGGAVGGIGGPIAFTVPFTGTIEISVTDCCLVGDVYQTFLDGALLGDTSAQPIGGTTNSSGLFSAFVAAGGHTFDIEDIILQYLGVASPYGGGIVGQEYDPAGLTVTISETPEPSTVAVIGIGLLSLLGLGFMRRRADAQAQ